MVIQYDTRPDATIDEKLRSLIESIMLALNEAGIKSDNIVTSTNMDIASVTALINDLSSEVASYSTVLTDVDGRVDTLEDTTIPALDGRVTTLEGRVALPAAPGTDGAYVLTVTVTDGVAAYTWEAQGV